MNQKTQRDQEPKAPASEDVAGSSAGALDLPPETHWVIWDGG